MRRRFTLVPPALACLLHLIAGCAPSSESAAGPDAGVSCPGSLADALGAACTMDGLKCYPQYACGILPAIATCTCTGGSFACLDVTANAVAEGGVPRCPGALTTATCPSTEALANQHACTESGLPCSYPSTCSGSREYDQCMCFSGPLENGQVGLRFECPAPCDSDAALVDTVDAGSESPHDATLGDAGLNDAPFVDAPRDTGRADSSGE